MPNMTVYVPDNTRERLRKHPEINVSAILQDALETVLSSIDDPIGAVVDRLPEEMELKATLALAGFPAEVDEGGLLAMVRQGEDCAAAYVSKFDDLVGQSFTVELNGQEAEIFVFNLVACVRMG